MLHACTLAFKIPLDSQLKEFQVQKRNNNNFSWEGQLERGKRQKIDLETEQVPEEMDSIFDAVDHYIGVWFDGGGGWTVPNEDDSNLGIEENDLKCQAEPNRIEGHVLNDDSQNTTKNDGSNTGPVETENNNFYKQDRKLVTVQQVWDEYVLGIDGGPSIKSLEAKYKGKWRKSSADKCFYLARTKIYNLTSELIASGKTPTESVEMLESIRLARKWSLNALQRNIAEVKFGLPGASPLNVITILQNSTTAPSLFYRLDPNLTTVEQVWEEYTRGINGGPSVKSLDQQYEGKWRVTEQARHLYLGRNKIYKAVKKYLAAGYSDQDAVSILENMRLAQNLPLDMFQREISDFATSAPAPEFDFEQVSNLTTINQVWQEYTEGLDGNPSVKSMDKEYGTKWRGPLKKLIYYKRNKIYRLVNDLVAARYTEQEAVDMLESIRIARKWTLDTFQRKIDEVRLSLFP